MTVRMVAAAWFIAALPVHAQDGVLSAAELELAPHVHIGTLPCELGQSVVIEADSAQQGFFQLRTGKSTYRLSPVVTTTGAIRLEDKSAGIVWLQLANKSMLMNQKLGRRLADECKSPAQQLIADELRRNPQASILDGDKPPATKP